VLDAPCGEGLLASRLAALGHEVWACDLDPTALAHADGIRFHVTDLNGPLPYPDGFFDAIVSLEGIEHLETPALCVQEFARVLRGGGRLVLSTPNVNNIQARLHYFLTGRFPGFKTLARKALEPPPRPVRWHVSVPYLPTIALLLSRHGLRA
jgi:2-polyprenyl-3-methyl-5-hydroxy-6-metoxy-1,4-benzoquinol methylase